MLQINHSKSTLWLDALAKMWITFNVQNTVNYGWNSCSFFLPRKVFPHRLGKKN